MCPPVGEGLLAPGRQLPAVGTVPLGVQFLFRLLGRGSRASLTSPVIQHPEPV